VHYLAHAQINPSGVATEEKRGEGSGGRKREERRRAAAAAAAGGGRRGGDREGGSEKLPVDDVDPLLPVTTRRRNSSDRANSRVLFPPDSVPLADSGSAFSFSLSGSLSGRD